jgi:hypothetical protein
MIYLAPILGCGIFTLIVWLGWKIPRRLGVPGIFVFHFTTIIAWIGMWAVADICGVRGDPLDGGFEGLNVLVCSFIINTFMLPVSIWGACERRRERLAAINSVQPTSGRSAPSGG